MLAYLLAVCVGSFLRLFMIETLNKEKIANAVKLI
jgi:hypothetical protein